LGIHIISDYIMKRLRNIEEVRHYIFDNNI
jgi:hypothetical protein